MSPQQRSLSRSTEVSQQLDREIIRRYTDQPVHLPADVREEIERALGGETIRLYALADLDSRKRLGKRWVALSDSYIVIANDQPPAPGVRPQPVSRRPVSEEVQVFCSFAGGLGMPVFFASSPTLAPIAVAGAAGGVLVQPSPTTRVFSDSVPGCDEHELHRRPSVLVQRIDRARVSRIREVRGLSCTTLSLLDGAGAAGAPLVSLSYTHRQRRTIENIRFVLEQQIAGRRTELTGDPDEVYETSVAHAVREAQAAVVGNRLAVIWRLLGYLKPYWRRLTLGLFAATLITITSLVPPYLTGRLLDGIIKPFQTGALASRAALTASLVLLALIGLSYVLREFFAWIRLRTMTVLGEFVARDLRHDLFQHLQRLSLDFFSSKQTGSIISRVSSDTDRIWDFIAFGVVEVSLSILTLTGLSIVLLWLDWPLGLVLTLPLPLLLYSIFAHGRVMHRMFLRAWRKWSNLTDVLSDTIPGVRVVKAFNQERQEKRRFDRRNQEAVTVFNQIHATWTSFWPGLLLAMHTMVVLVWLVAIPRLLGIAPDWLPPLSPGTFVSFLLYTGMFVTPIEIIGQMARMMNRATSSAHRVFEILDTRPQIVDVQSAVVLEPVKGQVTFEDVCFSYDGVRQVIRGMSFEVRPGEMIGLVGPSGSGKTTITNLIARFYEPTGGRLLIDGVDVCKLDTGSYRRQIGMVLQDPFLFHGSVLENIRYGRPDASVKQVIEAAIAANAHDFICRLPHGYDTTVGERGHTLSGGERQRVSIARAILCDPRILILDEATSSVDTETERNIQEALDRLVLGRTVFAIAHRLSTLRRADRLLYIEEGRVVEQGSHDELLAKEGGKYRHLHEIQNELHEMYAV